MDNEQAYLFNDQNLNLDIDNLDLIEEDFRVNQDEEVHTENTSEKFEYLNIETAKNRNKIEEYECEYFSPEYDLNLSKDFQLDFPAENNLATKIIPDKFQLLNNDQEFSDLSSISDIDNPHSPKNMKINFNNDEIKINLRMNNHEEKCTLNLEEDMSLNLIEQNDDEVKSNIGGITITIKDTLKKQIKQKRQKADLDKTPLPIFDCIYCSNEKVVFCHMIREKLSDKYLLVTTERELTKLSIILSNSNSHSIGINNSINTEAQHMRNFIIYHTEFLNRILDKKTIHKFFESLSTTFVPESYAPILKKKISFNFDSTLQTVNKNTLSLLNRLKSHRTDANNLSKNLMNSAMSPNFSNSNSIHTNTMYNYNNNFNYGEEVLCKKFEKTSLTEGIMEEKFEGELERDEDQEPSNFDKNESFLKFLRFDLKRKINFDDITWEEEYHDIWDPNLSQNSVQEDLREKSPALLKILNNFYKNQNSEDFLLEDSNDSNFIHVEVNDMQTSVEMAIDIENLIKGNNEANDDKNKIEGSSYSINPMISNFFEKSYNKNKIEKEKEKNSYKILKKYKSPSKENIFSPPLNFSTRKNNHTTHDPNSIKHGVLSPKSLRLDSLDSLCNKSRSLFNSMSHLKTVHQSAKKNIEKINSENISLNGGEFLDLNAEYIYPRRLKTEYKIEKDKLFSEKKSYFDSRKCFNSNFLINSTKDFFKTSKHSDRNFLFKYRTSNSNYKENLFLRENLNSSSNCFVDTLTPVDNSKYRADKNNIWPKNYDKNSLVDLISVFKKKFRNTENSNSTATSNLNGKSTLNNSKTWLKMSAKEKSKSKIKI